MSRLWFNDQEKICAQDDCDKIVNGIIDSAEDRQLFNGVDDEIVNEIKNEWRSIAYVVTQCE